MYLPLKCRNIIVLLTIANLILTTLFYLHMNTCKPGDSNCNLQKELSAEKLSSLSSSSIDDDKLFASNFGDNADKLKDDFKSGDFGPEGDCDCNDFIEPSTPTLPAVQMETPELQARFGLYTLCPPHYVISSPLDEYLNKEADASKYHSWGIGEEINFLEEDSRNSEENSRMKENVKNWPTIDPEALPKLPFLQARYVRMYSHWHSAMSRFRAKLVAVGELPYALNPNNGGNGTNLEKEVTLDTVLQSAVNMAGLTFKTPLLSNLEFTEGERSRSKNRGHYNNWNSSTWANQEISFEGFCRFSRSERNFTGEILSASQMPKILAYDGSLLFLKFDGLEGPQGDIMQWADLIIALHLIGYGPGLSFPLSWTKPCPSFGDYDIIFTDYAAISSPKCLYRYLIRGDMSYGLRCKLRVLDLFGTQEKFNFARLRGIFSNSRLPSMRQYLTLQPDRSPENTFLGFVSYQGTTPVRLPTGTSSNCSRKSTFSSSKSNNTRKRQNEWVAQIWGKGSSYFVTKFPGPPFELSSFLSQVSKHIPLKAFAEEEEREKIPSFVEISRRILEPQEVAEQLSRTALVVGLGRPLMASGLLEAVTIPGMHILFPKFDPPWTFRNQKEMMGKPTDQEMRSQHPFLEKVLGRPFVYAINITDKKDVEEALLDIRRDYEFLSELPPLKQKKEFAERKATALKAVEPFYGADSFLNRVHNIIESRSMCFGTDKRSYLSKIENSGDKRMGRAQKEETHHGLREKKPFIIDLESILNNANNNQPVLAIEVKG